MRSCVIHHDPTTTAGLEIPSLNLDTYDVVIEKLTPHDSEAMRALIRDGMGGFEEAGSVLASTFRRLESFDEIYMGSGAIFVIAKDKFSDLPVGGAGVGPLHGLNPSEGLGEIRDLVVHPDWRGRGIGGRLLRRCLDEARNFGYQRLYLETTPKMEHARQLFSRYGFRPITTSAKGVSSQGSMPDYFLLEKL